MLTFAFEFPAENLSRVKTEHAKLTKSGDIECVTVLSV